VERILPVKDHASYRQTLALVLDGESRCEVVAQADTVAGAYEALGGLGVATRAYKEIQPRRSHIRTADQPEVMGRGLSVPTTG
jgi:hypothetical protein